MENNETPERYQKKIFVKLSIKNKFNNYIGIFYYELRNYFISKFKKKPNLYNLLKSFNKNIIVPLVKNYLEKYNEIYEKEYFNNNLNKIKKIRFQRLKKNSSKKKNREFFKKNQF